jgi:hypothetical protein
MGSVPTLGDLTATKQTHHPDLLQPHFPDGRLKPGLITV